MKKVSHISQNFIALETQVKKLTDRMINKMLVCKKLVKDVRRQTKLTLSEG